MKAEYALWFCLFVAGAGFGSGVANYFCLKTLREVRQSLKALVDDTLEIAAIVAVEFIEPTKPEHDWYATKFAIAKKIRALKGKP